MDFFDGALVTKITRAERIYTKYIDGIYYKPRETHGFVFYLSGKCKYVFRCGVSFVAEKNMFLYLPKGEVYEIHPECDCSCILINLDTENKLSEQPFGALLPSYAKIHDRFCRAVNVFFRQKKGYMADLQSEAYKIISLVQSEQSNSYITQSTYKRIEPAVVYISNNYHDPSLTITKLSELCSMSERYFGRLFCSYYGVYPKQFIMNLRLELARSLLSSSDESIAHISDTCGFQNQYYFSRFFKRATGLTPSEYRTQNEGQ